jgi:hypothetical protein
MRAHFVRKPGLLAGLLLLMSAMMACGQGRPAAKTVAIAEARNETAAPSLSRHVHDAQRITGYLADALVLSTAQQLALQHCTVAERAALLLANSDTDARIAQANYLAAVRRVLANSQLRAYVLLRRQLEGTMLPIDGTELAVR